MIVMPLSTAFTRMFGVDHPIALAPLGGSAGGALAAAVSDAGGLGLLGAGGGDLPWLDREIATWIGGAIARTRWPPTTRPRTRTPTASPGVSCSPSPHGPAKASTSSTTSRPHTN